MQPFVQAILIYFIASLIYFVSPNWFSIPMRKSKKTQHIFISLVCSSTTNRHIHIPIPIPYSYHQFPSSLTRCKAQNWWKLMIIILCSFPMKKQFMMQRIKQKPANTHSKFNIIPTLTYMGCFIPHFKSSCYILYLNFRLWRCT